MKRHIILLFVFSLIFSLCACGPTQKAEEWPQNGLGSMLPVPDAKNIHIGYNFDNSFSADIKDAKEDDFTAYIAKCEVAGFTVDVNRDSDEYTAYNSDGYKVRISYYSGLKSVSISLDAPKVNGTFTWPTIGLATFLPTPSSNVGTISIDTHLQFEAWIGETTFDEYKAYVNLCIDNGFNVGYSNYEKVYSADNAEGISLRLEYQGFNTMFISVYAPDDEKEENTTAPVDSTNPAEETTTPADTEESESGNLVNGMRPEFKDALDSYEDFFEEYCSFMKKFADNPTDYKLLADYAKYMSQYSEMMSKLEQFDDGEMNEAETLYYIEVSGRITQMLLEVSFSIG